VFVFVAEFIFSRWQGDSHCGMRGFTRAVYDRMDLRSTGMEFAPSCDKSSAT